jgi:hypothetical protein
MNDRMKPISARDLELLSAALDGALNSKEQAALDARLLADPALRGELEQLRGTRALLRHAPRPRAPRNFTLTREMLPERGGLNALFPWLRTASVVAMILFVAVTSSDVLFSTVLSRTLGAAEPAAQSLMMADDADMTLGANAEMEMAMQPTGEFTEKSGDAPLPSIAPTNVNEDAERSSGDEDMAEDNAAGGGQDGGLDDVTSGAEESDEMQALPTATHAAAATQVVEADPYTEDEDFALVSPDGSLEGTLAEPAEADRFRAGPLWLRGLELGLLAVAIATAALAWKARRK